MFSFLRSLVKAAPKTPSGFNEPHSLPIYPSGEKGDFQLAKAKRELEKRLREDGYSRMQANRLVAEQFAQIAKKGTAPLSGMDGGAGTVAGGILASKDDEISAYSPIAKSASLT